ncbi:hypothetical protein [Nannocystis sp.]|uniref:hypothetical protein n=1 Tax=Nannocystis sp. TaxID=1962667 RepID=UPI0025E8CE3E|nr:hypothetical protein [Nannocystis sp.]
MLQEVDDLDQLVLGLVDARDVGEADLLFGLAVAAGAALAEAEHAAAAGLGGAPGQPHEGADQQQGRPEADQHAKPRRFVLVGRLDHDAPGREQRLEPRIGEARPPRLELLRCVRPAANLKPAAVAWHPADSAVRPSAARGSRRPPR